MAIRVTYDGINIGYIRDKRPFSSLLPNNLIVYKYVIVNNRPSIEYANHVIEYKEGDICSYWIYDYNIRSIVFIVHDLEPAPLGLLLTLRDHINSGIIIDEFIRKIHNDLINTTVLMSSMFSYRTLVSLFEYAEYFINIRIEPKNDHRKMTAVIYSNCISFISILLILLCNTFPEKYYHPFGKLFKYRKVDNAFVLHVTFA